MTEKTPTAMLDSLFSSINRGIEEFTPEIEATEIGRIHSIVQGIVWAEGLGRVKSEELVILGRDVTGLVLEILPKQVGIVLLGSGDSLRAGDEIARTGKILEIPVSDAMLGRVVNPLGIPIDGLGIFEADTMLPVQREAPPIMARAPVNRPLQTGIKVIDALIPIGRGQRELILGDRQSGKTAVALDAIINQQDKNVICIYCAIGQRSSSIAKVIAEMRQRQAMSYSILMVAEGNDSAGLQFIAPYAATSIGEYFMAKGRDVLIVYDDLTRHAQSYRQISLLLRRPPGREAFPGDIFYVHSRLLERSTRLGDDAGGGSLTAMPVIETEAQNISAYIPTNLISITDGQIYLSPDLFQKGILPAIDVGKSVSRVGGKAQLPAYRKVAGDLRLAYSQFQELESFARFGTRLDEPTRQTLNHGRRVREILKQNQFTLLAAAEQIAILFALNLKLFDQIDIDQVNPAQQAVIDLVRSTPDLNETITGAAPDDPVWKNLSFLLTGALAIFIKTDKTTPAGPDLQQPGKNSAES